MNNVPFYDNKEPYEHPEWYGENDMKITGIKIRPGILLGEIVLGTVAIWVACLGYPEIAGVAVGGICATLPKLVESEEKGD